MRILACGGRNFWNHDRVQEVLDEVAVGNDVTLITGGAPGADSCSLQWAIKRGVKYELYEAEWKKYGRAAGPKRNTRMLVEGRPELVIAFPGGRGTADMRRRAEAAGIQVLEIK